MKSIHIFILLVLLFVIGLFLYYVILFAPLTGWLLDYVITPVVNELFPNHIGMGEGILLWVICLALIYGLFFLPYILLWVIIIAILLLKRVKSKI